MTSIYICDGCGRQSKQACSSDKPWDWYERTVREKHETYHACSRECIEVVAKKFGGTAVVFPS